jgi:polysaccharide pyruvyl transferase WcaK-like protein
LARSIVSVFAVSRTGNRGAASMLESAIDNLAKGDDGCDFNVFTVYPRDDARVPPTPHVTLYNGTPLNLVLKLIPLCLLARILMTLRIKPPASALGAEMRAIFESGAVLIIGGTTFSDAQILKITYNIACLLPAILLGKRSMMYSQTLGPFRKPFNRVMAKFFLPKVTLIVPRGLGSMKNVTNIGLHNTHYYTDSAFSLNVPHEVERRIRERYAHMIEGRTVVGISVNSIVEKKCRARGIDHNGAFIELIRYLRERGYFILLVPHSMRERSKLRHNNDLFTVADIVAELPTTEGIHVVDDPYDCKELRVVVGLADYYVASRFHSMISALCTGVPVLVYGWGYQKYREVLEEFDLVPYCHDGRELTGKNLIDGFEEIVRDGEKIKALIRENFPRVAASSREMHETARRLARDPHFEPPYSLEDA